MHSPRRPAAATAPQLRVGATGVPQTHLHARANLPHHLACAWVPAHRRPSDPVVRSAPPPMGDPIGGVPVEDWSAPSPPSPSCSIPIVVHRGPRPLPIPPPAPSQSPLASALVDPGVEAGDPTGGGSRQQRGGGGARAVDPTVSGGI
ncbi:hypothetical protein PVAP13_8NG158700 [Panicum virgatum]|uniref:Uncharacterized protein n=1 Tax=Panicum virgatum TaxID=38727 RepID=A0A8T0P439_PANVG|nr:hypothetical protein PVAP13_8NG158700 [Panicum virgatum]